MNWIAAALGSALLFGMVSVLEKRILSVHVHRLVTFYLIVGLFQLPIVVGAVVVAPWGGEMPAVALLAGAASGLVWGAGLLSLFYALRVMEVSRVMAIYHTFPIFVAFMAVLLLNEELQLIHWLAIMMTAAGAGLVTMGQEGGARRGGLLLPVSMVLLASLNTAVANVAAKYALERLDFWVVMALRSGFLSLILMAPGVLPQEALRLWRLMATRRGLGLILVTEGLIVPGAVLATIGAISLGPVSLASTLMATRPFFVLLFSIALSTQALHLLNEPLRRDTLTVKLFSISLIVGGATLLTLA